MSPVARPEARQRLSTRAGLFLLGLLVFLLFRGVPFGERLFAADFHLTFQPLREVLGRALVDGFPGWNPQLSNGVPLAANPLNAAFYPLNWLFRAVPAATGLTWLTLLHVLFGAVGAFRLARRQGQFTPGAFTTAAVVAFSGIAVSATAHTNLGWSASWLPWLLLGLDRLSCPEPEERPWRGQLLVAGPVLALVLLGEPFVLLGGALGGALVMLETAARDRPRPAWRTAFPFLWPVALGLVLALPALLAYLDSAPHSVRGAGFTHEGVTQWSSHPASLVELVLPGVYGEPPLQSFDGATGYWARALVADKGYPLFAGSYVGGLVLALAALGGARGRSRWLLPTWLGLLVLLALGRFGPFTWLYGMPGLEALRYPVKWLVPAMLPLALLAGRGVDRVERTAVPTGRAPLAIALGITILAITGVSLGLQLPAALDALGGEAVAADRAVERAAVLRSTLRGLVPSIVALAMVYFALVRPAASPRAARHRAQWTAALLALLVGVDLVQANARLAPTVEPGFYQKVPALVSAIVQDRPHVQRIAVAKPRAVQFLRDPTYAEQARGQREALMGYTALAYGLDLAFGPDTEAFHPLRYAQLQTMVASAPPRERLMLLGAAGVTHLVTYERLDHPQATLVAELPDPSDPPLRVWRNGLALPRARVVARLVCHDGVEALIATLSSASDDLFRHAALLDREDRERAGLGQAVCASALPEPDSPPYEATVESVDDRGDSLSVVVSGDGGFLIVSDTWHPGWSATLDGQPVPLIRADYAFRAVALEAGRHEVVLTYDSW